MRKKRKLYNMQLTLLDKVAGRKYMFHKFGQFLSNMKVAYLNCKEKSTEDDIDLMLKDFEKLNEIQFTTLFDVPKMDF